MEEDIKILEKYIDEKEGALKIWQIGTINECEDLRVAIENLIARYKELENANKNWENMYDEDQEHIVELNNKISNLEWKNETFAKIFRSWRERIKEIIYPSPENPIELEIQNSKMYKELEKLVED